MLNTLVWSVHHKPNATLGGGDDDDGGAARAGSDDPLGQLAWLDATLARLERAPARVLIVGHIPPGLDSYSFSPCWRARYARAYLAIVARRASVVVGQLFGHLHTDEFRVSAPTTSGGGGRGARAPAPLLVVGSLSPVYDTAPSVRVHWAAGFGEAGGDGDEPSWELGYAARAASVSYTHLTLPTKRIV